MKPIPAVRVGQVWKDNDPRSGREVNVVTISRDVINPENSRVTIKGGSGRVTTASIMRFRPTRNGYVLVKDVPSGPESYHGEPGPIGPPGSVPTDEQLVTFVTPHIKGGNRLHVLSAAKDFVVALKDKLDGIAPLKLFVLQAVSGWQYCGGGAAVIAIDIADIPALLAEHEKARGEQPEGHGQVGADRAGLDFAIANEIPHGGYCPLGRKALDGQIPDKYDMVETLSSDYPTRTFKNIRDSDCTAVFTMARSPGRGSKLTLRLCDDFGRNRCHVWIGTGYDGQDRMANIHKLAAFFQSMLGDPRYVDGIVLNVAGTRDLGIVPHVHDLLRSVLYGR